MRRRRPLIATLREYVACDLNARRAADRLHIHVNTAHYRLGRIAERTGSDLRRVSDLIEILIAARLVDAELVAATQSRPPELGLRAHVLGGGQLSEAFLRPRQPNRRTVDEREPRPQPDRIRAALPGQRRRSGSTRRDDHLLRARRRDRSRRRVAPRDAASSPGDRVGIMLPNVPSSRSPTTACCAPAGWSCR